MFANLLRAGVLALIGLAAGGSLAAPPVAGGEPVGFGLIVGYREGVNPLSREETDRGPWADRRARMASAWQRATQRSRERTQQLARDTGVRAASVGEAGRAALLRFDRPMKGQDLADAMRRVRLHPDVAWVEPNVLVQRQAVPNDAGYGNQWYLRGPADAIPEVAGLNLTPAWDLHTGLNSTVVAVVDSGVRLDHSDLAGKLLPGYDFVSELHVANDGDGRDANPSDPGDWVSPTERSNNPLFAACEVGFSSWHGTFIAGQIAAATDNGQGVAGVNWQAKILPVRVSGKCGALVSDLLDGVRWAAGLPVAGAPANPNPAKVINLSFSGGAACSAAYQDAVDDASGAGALLVVAAGNQSAPLTRPADCDGVMAVAAVRRDGAKADYSSFGSKVALTAPGGSLENFPNNLLYATSDSGFTNPGVETYGYKQGTSFSAPLAAGVASLMLARNPALTPRALMERMQAGARPHQQPLGPAGPVCSAVNTQVCHCTPDTCGAGLLDAHAAMQLAIGPAAVIQPVGTVVPGAVITLDGRSSVALGGATIASHQWSLDSGPAVVIPNGTQALTTLQLPSVEGRWVFRLTVTDSNGDDGSDAIVVRAVAPPPPPAAAGGGGGSFGGWWGLALMLWSASLIRANRRR
ncbi:MAG: S8 family serine peptidase [Hydrogenophaga sp.]|uniref:S8 family peptidase n=1 Tax=Hydrogenophaga sp. TaxID=1904254 RepID=UPI00168E1216|nr:S8 family peptidase [Hydrogenophaga sp.]NIM39807.1 S8 family serine peptidase [Hydrogenophaga sp.]NIN25011.1 S8 family serine peptidase [Hydrogenophaga sp.]NIN29523.1 S8 family serine peptidase [Hydrogenophaga sp.]NIN54046.1 S8 family serine peptidase [Hydrogenophaga sp.]NIO50250.1 S8 family serine peptidase [Hydrogenophaga sp.]